MKVSRLPAEVQFAFAETSVREGLPKSAIESLVAGYNNEGCPDTVKAQILRDPKAALKRVADNRRAVSAGQTEFSRKTTRHDDITGCIEEAKSQMAALCSMLFNKSPYEIQGYKGALKELETELSALLTIIQKLVSPGKMEVRQDEG